MNEIILQTIKIENNMVENRKSINNMLYYLHKQKK